MLPSLLPLLPLLLLLPPILQPFGGLALVLAVLEYQTICLGLVVLIGQRANFAVRLLELSGRSGPIANIGRVVQRGGTAKIIVTLWASPDPTSSKFHPHVRLNDEADGVKGPIPNVRPFGRQRCQTHQQLNRRPTKQ